MNSNSRHVVPSKFLPNCSQFCSLSFLKRGPYVKKARRARATNVVRHFIDDIVRADNPIFPVFSNSLEQSVDANSVNHASANIGWNRFGPFIWWQMLREGYFWLEIIQLCQYILWIQSNYYCWPKQVEISITTSYLNVTLICQICANPSAKGIMDVATCSSTS